jgi:predicted TIM-barrel fold metal-dependent hydrolase
MIIDAHCHLGRSPQFHFPDVSLRAVLATMDQLGIARAVCCHLGMLQGAWELGLQESIEAYQESEGRIRCYVAFDPHMPDGLERVARCLDREEFVGIKIHPTMHGCYGDEACYDVVWQLARQRGIPILTHSWDLSEQNPSQKFSYPDRFAGYAERYPNVLLILGHAGGRYRGHQAAAALARRCPNVLLDTSGDCYTLGLIEYLVQQAGADKVLFGSDLTWLDPRTQLGMILDAEITASVRQQILGVNAARVFGWASQNPEGKML